MSGATYPSRLDLIVALGEAAEALKPIADWVYNDNGDLTISHEVVAYDEVVAIWRAEFRARRLLTAAASASIAEQESEKIGSRRLRLIAEAGEMYRLKVDEINRITDREIDEWYARKSRPAPVHTQGRPA